MFIWKHDIAGISFTTLGYHYVAPTKKFFVRKYYELTKCLIQNKIEEEVKLDLDGTKVKIKVQMNTPNGFSKRGKVEFVDNVNTTILEIESKDTDEEITVIKESQTLEVKKPWFSRPSIHAVANEVEPIILATKDKSGCEKNFFLWFEAHIDKEQIVTYLIVSDNFASIL